VSEDVDDVASDIGTVGEGQIGITGTSEGDLALGKVPAEQPLGRRMSDPNQ